MRDNQLFPVIIAALDSGFADMQIQNIVVQQAYQPTQQGIPTQSTIFLTKFPDRRVGAIYQANVWDSGLEKIRMTELQQMESTFQLNALSTQDPANVNSYTAADLVNAAAYIMQRQKTLDAFKAADIGILKITDIRNPYFVDDRNQNEASPSFDFTITHKQVIVTEAPTVESFEFNINRI